MKRQENSNTYIPISQTLAILDIYLVLLTHQSAWVSGQVPLFNSAFTSNECILQINSVKLRREFEYYAQMFYRVSPRTKT